MAKCMICKKNLGWFSSTTSCEFEDCSYMECGDCVNLDKSQIQPCPECESNLCTKHFDKHDCGDMSEEDEDDESEKIEENTHYVFSTNKELLQIDRTTFEYVIDELDTILAFEEKGYEIDYELTKAIGEQEKLYLRKTNKR